MRMQPPRTFGNPQRKLQRQFKRMVRHSRYAAGGSTQQERERLRRIDQMVKGHLTTSNGVVRE